MLTFDQELRDLQVPASRFSLVGPGIDQDVQTVWISGATVYLELSSRLADDPEQFAVVYRSRTSGGLTGLNGARVEDSAFVVWNYTETAPTVVSAAVDLTTLEVGFDQRLEVTEVLPSDFTVIAGRRTITVESLDWSTSGLSLTLSERVTALDVVALLYSPSDGEAVRDASGLALASFRYEVENQTAKRSATAARVEDAMLRASSGETTLERELERGFASNDRLRVSVSSDSGWGTVVREETVIAIDASSLGDAPARIQVAQIERPANMLEHFAAIPSWCWSESSASRTSVWWIGASDLLGVPVDSGVQVSLSGLPDAAANGSMCVLDLVTGAWSVVPAGGAFAAPALVFARTGEPAIIQLRATRAGSLPRR